MPHLLLQVAMAATLATATPPAPQEHLVAHVVAALPTWAKREAYALELVAAVHREGRRRGLDPLALLAVAQVESGWQPWRTMRWDGSHGPFQLIGHHPGPREARALLAGCRPPAHLLPTWGRWWALRGQGEPCEAPRVAARRRTLGTWTVAELRDPVVATYLAAAEVQRHVATCHRLRHRAHRAPRWCPRWLVRWGHYNSGWNPPRWYYLQRLCKAWHQLRRLTPRPSVVLHSPPGGAHHGPAGSADGSH